MNDISSRALLDSATEMGRPSSLIQRPSSPGVRTSATRDDSPMLNIKDSNGSYCACGRSTCEAGNGSGGDGSCEWHSDSPLGRRGGREHSVNNGVARHAHGGGGHVGHSHGMGVAGDGVMVRLALLLALSVHSVMEGLGLGARSTKAWNLLFAIFIHKVRTRKGRRESHTSVCSRQLFGVYASRLSSVDHDTICGGCL